MTKGIVRHPNLLFRFTLLIILVGVFLLLQLNDQRKINALRCADCNVILIGVDTLRADHLSAYGYARKTSPNIDKFSQKGVLFKKAYSQSISTTPSFMSILTSLYPTDHGILFTGPALLNLPTVKINDSIKTLPEILHENGYKTKALVTSPFLPPKLGFGRGFDEFSEDTIPEQRKNLLGWLEMRGKEKFFIFYHDMGPHAPYFSPSPYKNLFEPNYKGDISWEVSEGLVGEKSKEEEAVLDSRVFWAKVSPSDPKDVYRLNALYDGTIKYLDDFIGDLQKVLDKENLWKKTIIIFTADHGEEFQEHGEFDHKQFYNQLLHVPLIINTPSISKGMQIDQRVRSIDVMPTILDLLGIKIEIPMRGNSLLPLIQNPKGESEDRPIIAISKIDKTVIVGNYKYIDQRYVQRIIKKYPVNKLHEELYDLKSDPLELKNIFNENKEMADKLKKLLKITIDDDFYAKKPTKINLKLEGDVLEEMKSLGY